MEKTSSNIAHSTGCLPRRRPARARRSLGAQRTNRTRGFPLPFPPSPTPLTAPRRGRRARRPPGSTAGCVGLRAGDEQRLSPRRQSAAPRSPSRPRPSAPHAPSPPLPTALPVPGPGGPPPSHHLSSRSRTSLSCRQGKAFWGRGRNAKPAAPRRSPAAILRRLRGGCHRDGAARGAQPPAPAAGLGPVTSVPPRARPPSP